jgi:deoxyribodipyrimidine photolyase
MKIEKALVWFRRDLRDHDHAALSAALAKQSRFIAPLFSTAKFSMRCLQSGIAVSFHP